MRGDSVDGARGSVVHAVLVVLGVIVVLGLGAGGARASEPLAGASEPLAGAGLLQDGGSSSVAAPAVATLPSRFHDTVAIGGLTAPTVIRFSPDGRVFVAEKSGIVLEYDSLTDTTPTTVVDLSAEVSSSGDRGVLGLTLDPHFPASPYIYLLYTYDAPPGETAPVWHDQCGAPPAGGGSIDGCPVTGKLVRIALSGNVMTGSPTTLIQDQWCQQFSSHSIGDLNFGPDGYLYASAGEGANFTATADWGQSGGLPNSPVPPNPCGDPPAGKGGAETSPTSEGGALRSQSVRRASGEPVLLNGTVIRVDPSTGAGAPDNPFVSSTDQNKRRIIAYGLRNPFRFTFRPGTGDLWIADVGWGTWEEVDVDNDVTGSAKNYGWPCYEGPDQRSEYSGFNLCSSLAAGSVASPYFSYRHNAPVVAGETCPASPTSSISGISFYTGVSYPTSYDGALFFVDHSRNCIWAMLPGSNGLPDPSSIQTFDAGAAHPVDLVVGPAGDLFYVDVDDGEIHRITYAAPAVTLTTPTTGSVTNQATPTLSGAAGTASGDESTVTVRIYSGSTASGTPVQTLTTTASGATWSATARAPLSDGQYTAQAEQIDNAGSHGFSAPANFSVDTTPPAVTLATPASGSATNAATPTVSGAAGTTSGDLTTIMVRIYGGRTASGTSAQTLTTTARGTSWTAKATAPLSNGQYTAQAEQDDSAGNHGLSTPTTFTVDTTPPVNTSLPAVSGFPSVGQTLQCSPGSWSGLTQQTYTERWLRGGHPITGATGARYRIVSTDARHKLACQVTAHSVAGSTSATSKALLARAAAGAASVGRARVHGTVATVPISCAGIKTQSCTAVLTMTVREKRSGSTIVSLAAAQSHGINSTRTIVLGTRRVVLHGGARSTVRLPLNQIGRQLLSSRIRLPAKLTTTQRMSRRRHVVSVQLLTFTTTHPAASARSSGAEIRLGPPQQILRLVDGAAERVVTLWRSWS